MIVINVIIVHFFKSGQVKFSQLAAFPRKDPSYPIYPLLPPSLEARPFPPR